MPLSWATITFCLFKNLAAKNNSKNLAAKAHPLLHPPTPKLKSIRCGFVVSLLGVLGRERKLGDLSGR